MQLLAETSDFDMHLLGTAFYSTVEYSYDKMRNRLGSCQYETDIWEGCSLVLHFDAFSITLRPSWYLTYLYIKDYPGYIDCT